MSDVITQYLRHNPASSSLMLGGNRSGPAVLLEGGHTDERGRVASKVFSLGPLAEVHTQGHDKCG